MAVRSLSSTTGAAATRLEVNRPAQVEARSESNIAMSVRSALMPAATPHALKPLAEVAPPLSIHLNLEFIVKEAYNNAQQVRRVNE